MERSTRVDISAAKSTNKVMGKKVDERNKALEKTMSARSRAPILKEIRTD